MCGRVLACPAVLCHSPPAGAAITHLCRWACAAGEVGLAVAESSGRLVVLISIVAPVPAVERFFNAVLPRSPRKIRHPC